MGRFSALGLVAFALCLFACVSVSAEVKGSEAEKIAVALQEATQAVSDAKNSIKEVSDKAQYNIGNATLLLQKVKLFKQQADDAENEAQVAERNEKAKAIVGNVKISAKAVNTLCGETIAELESANSSMVKLLLETKTLEDQSNTLLPSTEATYEKYAEAKNRATDIKTKAEKLNTNITNASTIISAVQLKLQQIEESAKKAQVDNLHVSCIGAATEIETNIKDTDSILQETANKRNLVNGIVEEMKKYCTTELIGSYEIIKEQCNSATDQLQKATGALEKAQQAEAEMKKQKDIADAALKNVQAAKEVKKAQDEVTNANGCVDNVKESVLQLRSALQEAQTSLTNVNASQQKMVKALSTTTSAPTPEEVKETEKSDLSLEEGTGTDQTDATKQPIPTDKEQQTSKESPDQSNNSAGKLKDTLSQGAHNVSTTALTGGKAPAPGANNDSAMTVSVPLLVALIASAVLQ